MEHFYRSLLVVLLLHNVKSFVDYRKHIPNGFSVPFPCKPGETWLAAGHFGPLGTGDLNPFGQDLALSNNTWTEELCRKDSDGDGKPNGLELGDPHCLWTVGDAPTITAGLSHPGICDPWNSTCCRQKKFSGSVYRTQKEWLDFECRSRGFECPALREEGIRNVTFRLPAGSPVPTEETSYTCILLDLPSLGIPSDQDFHMVAVTPIFDNESLIHHISLAICLDEIPISPTTFRCDFIVSERCPERIHIWTVGLEGECFNPLTGIRMGPNGAKKLAIQVHWNNPQLTPGLTDSSGLVLHYTPHLRPHDAGILMIGSSLFTLPPKQPELLVNSHCASQCTSQHMTGPINITSALNHMHFTGIRMNIEVTRDKRHVTNLTDDREFSFFKPVILEFSQPFVFYPGDELRTNCVYSTVDRNKTTLSGLGARDEMCLGFLYYFPRQSVTQSTCLDNLEVSLCNKKSWGQCKDLPKFVEQIQSTQVFQQVLENCQSYVPCLTECLQTVVKFMRSEPCMQGRVWEYIQDTLKHVPEGQVFLSKLASCKVEAYLALNSAKKPKVTRRY